MEIKLQDRDTVKLVHRIGIINAKLGRLERRRDRLHEELNRRIEEMAAERCVCDTPGDTWLVCEVHGPEYEARLVEKREVAR